MLSFDFSCPALSYRSVKVMTTEYEVAITGENSELSLIDIHHRYVQCASTKIYNDDFLPVELCVAIGKGRGGWLGDDSRVREPGDLSCISHGLPLYFIEEGRNGNDRSVGRFPNEGTGRNAELFQNVRLDFLGTYQLFVYLNPRIAVRRSSYSVRQRV